MLKKKHINNGNTSKLQYINLDVRWVMESARVNPKNPQGDYLLRPTYCLAEDKIVRRFQMFYVKQGKGYTCQFPYSARDKGPVQDGQQKEASGESCNNVNIGYLDNVF